MDKFKKVFEVDIQNSLDKFDGKTKSLTEDNGTIKPKFREGFKSLVGRNPPAEHLYKNGVHARAGAGKFVKISHAAGTVLPFDLGATGLSLDAYDKTAKAYLGKGGSMKKGRAQGYRSAVESGKRHGLSGLVMGAASGGATGGVKGAVTGSIAQSVQGALGGGLSQKVGEVGWYRRKARKMGVAEAVLAEVKERIASRKLEEGIGSIAAGLLSKVKGLKAVKQAGNVVSDLKDTAQAIGPRYKLYKGIGKTKLGALKANVGAVGRGIADTAKTNPYGAALVGGGTLGTTGLAAWGLKKPKQAVQESAPPWTKGGDEGKGGKGAEILAKAKAKKKGGKKGVPPEFLKGKGKGKDEEGGKKELPAFLQK